MCRCIYSHKTSIFIIAPVLAIYAKQLEIHRIFSVRTLETFVRGLDGSKHSSRFNLKRLCNLIQSPIHNIQKSKSNHAPRMTESSLCFSEEADCAFNTMNLIDNNVSLFCETRYIAIPDTKFIKTKTVSPR